MYCVFSPSLTVPPQHECSGDHHICQCQWNHTAPAEVHQLVVPKARNRPPYPHKEKYEEENTLEFELISDQSFLNSTILELETMIEQYGDNTGIKNN